MHLLTVANPWQAIRRRNIAATQAIASRLNYAKADAPSTSCFLLFPHRETEANCFYASGYLWLPWLGRMYMNDSSCSLQRA